MASIIKKLAIDSDMSGKKLLVASSHKSEAMTKWIMESELLNSSIDIIFIEELLDNFEIRDELDQNGPSIQWFDTVGNQYSNKTHYLLNRVINVEECLFDKFQLEDKDYAQREFEAYLGFALNAFDSPQNQAINGICERYKTLPQQWQMVKAIKDLSIPNYYWGSPCYKFLSDEKDLVYSDIYDCLNWSKNHDSYGEDTGFRFVKPKGEPVFILAIGQRDLITTNALLTEEQQERIKQITQQIRSLFGYFIFELLLFIHEEQITFGCTNIDVIQSAKNPGFDDFMQKYFIEECSKCLN